MMIDDILYTATAEMVVWKLDPIWNQPIEILKKKEINLEIDSSINLRLNQNLTFEDAYWNPVDEFDNYDKELDLKKEVLIKSNSKITPENNLAVKLTEEIITTPKKVRFNQLFLFV